MVGTLRTPFCCRQGDFSIGAHSMIARTIAAALLTVGLSQAALAEGTTSNPSSTTSSQTNRDTLPQELRQKLQEAGYKNIEIVPGSYLVNAQDAQGNNIMMRIGPNSMTVLSEASANNSTTTGSNSNNNQSGSGSTSSSNSSAGQTNNTGAK
jgi:hypothetical protein